MTTQEKLKDAKVVHMLNSTPLYAHQLICAMEGKKYKWMNSTAFIKYYRSLPKDDPKRLALEEMATHNLSATRKKEGEAVAKELAAKYKNTPPQTREEVEEEISQDGEEMHEAIQNAEKAVEQPKEQPKKKLTADQRLDQCIDLAAYTVIQYEGFTAKANWDVTGYAIAFGNHTHPNGRAVSENDRITSAEQATPYFKAHFDKNIRETMKAQLPIDKMTDQEIVAMTSICYNCGAGVLCGDLGKKARAYFNNRNDPKAKAAFEKAYKARCTKKGQKKSFEPLVARRNSEWDILTGKIQITIDPDTPTQGNTVNIKHKVGVLTDLGRRNEKQWESYLKNRPEVKDSVDHVVSQGLCPVPIRRTTAPAKKAAPVKKKTTPVKKCPVPPKRKGNSR